MKFNEPSLLSRRPGIQWLLFVVVAAWAFSRRH